MSRVIIVGAGLTGLSTAYHLEQNGFYDYVILEREAEPGGLCRSVSKDGFTFDYTGHLLHIQDELEGAYTRELLQKISGFENWLDITRRSYIYSHDIYTRYPFQNNLYGLPIDVIAECIESFVLRENKDENNSKSPEFFIDWVHKHFGAGIAKHFFLPYQSKIFNYPVDKLTSSWTQKFVPRITLKSILESLIEEAKTSKNLKKEHKTVGYNAQFWYPKTGGITTLIKNFAQTLKNKICFSKNVYSLDLKNKTVLYVDQNKNTKSQESFDILVNTGPLDSLLNNLITNTETSLQLNNSAKNLICTSVMNINLGINSRLSDKHWIYFPEHTYPFYRIGFASNFSPNMAPENQTAVYAECSYNHKLLKTSHEQINKLIADNTNAVCNFLDIHDKSQIASCVVLPIEHAYVIYNSWRDKHIDALLNQLKNYNVHSIGRYGAWKYTSMQESIIDGKLCAEQIIKNYNF